MSWRASKIDFRKPDRQSLRTLLAFYTTEPGQGITPALQAAQGAGIRDASVIQSTAESNNSRLREYANLLLEGESLLVAPVTRNQVLPAVQNLARIGHASAFVLRALPEPGEAVQAPERWDEPPPSLSESDQRIESAHADLVEAMGLGHTPTPAAAWFLDNPYLIRANLKEIRSDLPREFRKMLSGGKSTASPPRAYWLARVLVRRNRGALNESEISGFLQDFQTTAALSISELWTFPLFLRMALIEQLAELASSVAGAQAFRERAHLWADRLPAAARRGDEVLAQMLAKMESEPYAQHGRFVTSLAEQLQGEETALAGIHHWIEEHIDQSLTDLVRAEHTREAAESVATAQAFTSLRLLSHLDFAKVFEAVSLVEAELRKDPGEIYPKSDFATRDECRRAVELIARASGRDELDTARLAVQLAAAADDPAQRHVSYYLLSEGVLRLEQEAGARIPLRPRFLRSIRRHATGLYLGAFTILTACFVGISVAVAHEVGVLNPWILSALGILATFPISEFSLQIVNALVISIFPPSVLPKMDFKEGIPPEHSALVVIPMMLSSEETVAREAGKLEVRFLANPEGNLFYALFSDFTDAPQVSTVDDAPRLKAARESIAALNARYPGDRFLLFHRPRVWCESEQRWIGRERKRGKIEDLNAFLTGQGSPGILNLGRLPHPVRYVITLDADTQLPPGTARRMVETLAHPLNQVELDAETKVRRTGYSIIQPRVSVSLPGATATRFTHIFADTSGTDPYCRAVSDAQQDLFAEGIFHGKAIYEVQSFQTALGNRFPDETLLSHDLIEGSHGGVALASDIEVFENLPLDYSSFVRREHRWIRGDWQIAPWILPRVPNPDGSSGPNPLSAIQRWRILDNLRRSLVPAASLLLLLLGWLISAAPVVWSLAVALAVVVPAVAPLLDRWARHFQNSVGRWRGAADELLRAGAMMVFLPHQAWISVDAAFRASYRSYISRRHMLEWQTAEVAEVHAHHHRRTTRRQMLIVSGASILLFLALSVRGAFVPTLGFLVLWAFSPLLLIWLDSPAPSSPSREVSAGYTSYLRRIARRTWRYFDDLVGPDTNWLPPDNSQLALRVEVARRTSPTNIGLWLTSAVAARDFGYLNADELCRRCSATIEVIDGLERYEGHLLNWYDTTTKQPLLPKYVSSVDSGNLLASLWVLEQGCQDTIHAPLIPTECLRGLADSASILSEVSGHDPSLSLPLRAIRRLLRGDVEGHELIGRLRMAFHPVEQLGEIRHWQTASVDEPAYWASCLAREVASWTEMVNRYLRWMETLSRPPDTFLQALGDDVVKLRRRALHTIPSLLALARTGSTPLEAILSRRGMPDMRPDAAAWLDQVGSEYHEARTNAADIVARFETLSASAARIAQAINMRFLYDPRRRLFAVGYVVGGPPDFSSHYDLLASESRLASLVAVAKGDVPVEHWFALGRPYGTGHHRQTLLSWSGTMFEYLMPLLFTRAYANSLLHQACGEAVDRQIEFGRKGNIPWGISECAYSALDANQTYQYKAFGVPELALQPDMDEEPVVAPYATILALMVDPRNAIANLKRLEGIGMAGPMGFYESIDFSRESKRDGQPGVVIYAYMAHHMGMTLCALDNVIHRDAMQRRFHRDPRIRAVEPLLFERIPVVKVGLGERQTKLIPPHPGVADEAPEVILNKPTTVPRVHLYGNGRYALMVTNSGASHSRWNDIDVTRWRADATLDEWGAFIYLRDVRSGTVWATTSQPLSGELGESSVTFSADRAEYRRAVQGIETLMSVTVSAEDDVELRRLIVTNRSSRSRVLELTSYLELALAPHGADRAHPAFSKLFIETTSTEETVLLAHRRPRSPDDEPIWAAHMVTGASGGVEFETDRAQFLGRGNTVHAPAALRSRLTATTGTVIDPVFSVRCREALDPRERRELVFVTIAAHSREELMTLVAKYRRKESVFRAFEMAWTRAQLEFRFLQIGPAAAQRYQELAGPLLYPNSRLRTSARRLAANRLGQSALWSHGISGDIPMLTAIVGDSSGLALVRELLSAHTYWRMRGFQADLVILNQEPASYDRPFHQQLQRQVEAYAREAGINRPGGIFLLSWPTIPEEQRNLLLAASRAVFNGSRGPLQRQLAAGEDPLARTPFVPVPGRTEEPSPALPFLELPYFNGIGGFTADAREYAIYLGPDRVTPAPWINVIANSHFGALVNESGLGFTWCGNSQQNRLTSWTNDPVSDPPAEAIYLRDEESGARWSPTPLPIRERDAYRARHGQGYTVFEHNSHAIGQELTVFVPISEGGDGDPVKLCLLRLRNDSSRRRRLTVTYFAEWVLGSVREDQQLHVQTEFDQESGALFARQSWNESYANQIAFAAASPQASSYSGDRAQFLGRNRSWANPAALDYVKLDGRCSAGLDPAAALQVLVTIEPGQSAEVIFQIGQAQTPEAVRELVRRYQNADAVKHALATTLEWWDRKLSVVQVKTPQLSTDFLLNRWLLYQTLSCRFWARSALYQSGGAFGFRDQLQDSLAFLYCAPEITREHILTAAARQFVEGDVQHWWHPQSGLGVRTRCSDDLLWLPFAVAQYLTITQDDSILDAIVPFLEAPALEPHDHERISIPTVSSESASLWEHCRRAIEHGWRLGQHGLPLFGNGDWNDGMNRVGAEGRGESVWLGWFLCRVLKSCAPIADLREPGLGAKWFAQAGSLANAIERSCWDGEWYLRGFFDDGSPLGSHANPEAKIDSLPQSWAVISGSGDPQRTRTAMESADRELVQPNNNLVLLFTPPFDHSQPHPGYVMGYPPGVRENGGQYTHGSLWLAMAWARMGRRTGDGTRAVDLLRMMNPIELARDPQSAAKYGGEPYVAPADVSSAPGRVGRSGWTWYTGSAGWMYRIWLEEVLGLQVRGRMLTLSPVIPADWPGFELVYKYKSATYEISVKRGEREGLQIDGRPSETTSIWLNDDGATHRITMGLALRRQVCRSRSEASAAERAKWFERSR